MFLRQANDTIKRIIPQLILHGRVKRVGFGIRILPDSVAQRWGVEGVIVREASPGSAALRAGLRAMEVDRRGNVYSFDTITAIDGQAVRSYDDLYQALDGRKAGQEVALEYEREGRKRRTSVVLQDLN